MRRRAELYCQQLDALRFLRQQARKELLAEARKHSATKLLCQIPGIGSLRAAHLVGLMQTPHRFRTKRQLWTYSGLALETHDSAQYRYVQGQLQRSKKPQQLRGLNDNHNHDLKNIFKGAAMHWQGLLMPLLRRRSRLLSGCGVSPDATGQEYTHQLLPSANHGKRHVGHLSFNFKLDVLVK